MKKNKSIPKEVEKPEGADQHAEGMIELFIALNTFPLESDEELEERKKKIDDLKEMNNNKPK